MKMEQRLQKQEILIISQSREIQQLKKQKDKLISQMVLKQHQYDQSKQQFIKFHPSYLNYKNKVIILSHRFNEYHWQSLKVFQSKVQILNSQLIQIQKLNSRYKQALIQQRTEVIKVMRQQIFHKIENRIIKSELVLRKYQKPDQEKQVVQILGRLKELTNEKERIIKQNKKLETQIKSQKRISSLTIKKLLKQNKQLKLKVQYISEIEEQRLKQYRKGTDELLQENKRLQLAVSEKNRLLNLYFTESEQLLSTDRINTAHTIKCLKNEVIKKGKIIEEMLNRALEVQKSFQNYKQFLSKQTSIKLQIKSLIKSNRTVQIQNFQLNQIIKQKNEEIKDKMQQIKDLETSLYQQDERLVQLILENEACHKLFYQAKGSVIYTRFVKQKMELLLKQIEKRKVQQKWTDITELVNVNRKLRRHRCL